MTITPDTFLLYGLIRTDMASLNPGKLAAQAMHAQRLADNEILEQKKYGPEWVRNYKIWCAQSKQSYGYTLTLDVDTGVLLNKVAKFALRAGFPAGVVHDETYPLVDGRVVHYIPVDTVGYLFGKKGDLDILLGRFGLCP